ncbi:hypothetical protein HA50_12245 [Pantoea cypripedii]|uniref:Uncharacterized protein n=2 Tax=Pantoea cypripedii TaxID=55209 RepID=A0A1X1EVR5_PANCY|nr:hypothetical protein HA50_12245 [Pantoea cypripedii]
MQRNPGIFASAMMFFYIFPQAEVSAEIIKSNEDAAILAVHQAIRDHQLSPLRDQCLTYDYDETSDKDFFIVDVREDKRYAICGGDPETSIHLFTFKINRNNHSLMTDANSDSGDFYTIKK